jgi:4-carboxymuconolactone decarboxylase
VHQPLAEAAGVPTGVLGQIRSGDPVEWADERLRLVEQAAHEVFREHGVNESTFAELHRLFGERQTFELVTIFGYYATLAIVLNTYGITE